MVKNRLNIGLFVLSLSFFNIKTDSSSEYNSVFVIPKTTLSHPNLTTYRLKKSRKALGYNIADQYYLVGRKFQKNHKGMWTLIGGKRETFENNPIETAKREFKEETLGAIKINLNQKSIINTYNLKDLKKIVYVVYMSYEELISGSKKFYKVVEKEKIKILNNNPDNIEIDKLALIKVDSLQDLSKKRSNLIEALVLQPDGTHKVEQIELRSSAGQILRKIALKR